MATAAVASSLVGVSSPSVVVFKRASSNSLLSLPYEIRLYLYKLMFETPTTIKLAVIDGCVGQRGWTGTKARISLQFLATCKQVYREASPVVYREKTFRLSWENLSLPSPGLELGLQRLSQLMQTIEIDCRAGHPWGFVALIKTLAKRIPDLLLVSLNFKSSARLMAASVEISDALVRCASTFEGPSLDLRVSVLKRDEHPDMNNPLSVTKVFDALAKNGSKLSDLHGLADSSVDQQLITKYHAPHLAIRLNGPISPGLVGKLDGHTCTTGGCAWMVQSEEVSAVFVSKTMTSKRINYSWASIGCPGHETPVLEMLKWYPELPKKTKQELLAMGRPPYPSESKHETKTATPKGSKAVPATEVGRRLLFDRVAHAADTGDDYDNASSAMSTNVDVNAHAADTGDDYHNAYSAISANAVVNAYVAAAAANADATLAAATTLNNSTANFVFDHNAGFLLGDQSWPFDNLDIDPRVDDLTLGSQLQPIEPATWAAEVEAARTNQEGS